jgi:hypothetical protein
MTSIRITPKRDPKLTYPVVTRMGIREVPGNVADNMEFRNRADRDLICELFERVEALEKLLRSADIPYKVQGLR